MTKTVKALSLFGMVSVLVAGVSVALSGGFESSIAEACEHNGNHYTALAATRTTTGTKEYWVCCKCHEHFFSYQAGTWAEAGVAEAVSREDDRYIPMLQKPDENGFTYDETGTTILTYDGSQGGNVVIPEGVTEIGPDAFKGNNNVTSIILPETVTEIGEGAFQDCQNLEYVVIPSSVESIGKNAFYISGVSRSDKNDVVVYVSFTREEEQEMIKNGELDKEWKHGSTTSPLGWGWIKTEHDVTVYYQGEWHLNENGEPVKN